MATTRFEGSYLEIGLDDIETKALMDVLKPISGAGGAVAILSFFKGMGIAATLGATAPWIAMAIAIHVALELAAIAASNRGWGVWLFAPSSIWLAGGAGIVIPQPRTLAKAFDGTLDTGTMQSEKGDEVTWTIERGVGKPDDCKFELVNACDWDKAYKLYIEADTWWVQANGHQTAENSAWAHQLSKTQIVFHKPQILGYWGHAELTISDFNGINAQDVTTLRWVKDRIS